MQLVNNKQFYSVFLILVSICSFSCNSNSQSIQEVKQYYNNGQIKATGFIKDGKKVSNAKLYYPNGNLKQVGQWQNDKQEGLWIFYYEDGTVSGKANFKNDEQDGLCELLFFQRK